MTAHYDLVITDINMPDVNGLELILFNGGSHFKLTPAMSLFVHCRTQKEIDTYWAKLTKGGKESHDPVI